MAKHTPAPWELEATEDGFEVRMATAIENPGFHDTNHLIEWDLCMSPEDGEQYEEAHATARLIAAAPTMLEALIAAEQHFGPFADITINGKHDADDVRVVALIRNAIAKAEGN